MIDSFRLKDVSEIDSPQEDFSFDCSFGEDDINHPVIPLPSSHSTPNFPELLTDVKRMKNSNSPFSLFQQHSKEAPARIGVFDSRLIRRHRALSLSEVHGGTDCFIQLETNSTIWAKISKTDLVTLVSRADQGLKHGVKPFLVDGALGGTYFLLDRDKIKTIVCKPGDEEPNCPNNPRTPSVPITPPSNSSSSSSSTPSSEFFVSPPSPPTSNFPSLLPPPSSASPPLTPSSRWETYKGGVVPGFGMYLEVAAYLLDDGFCGVPPTCLARVRHPELSLRPLKDGQYFHDRSRCKLSSVQTFVNHEDCAEDMGDCMFHPGDVQRLAVFDIRLCNLDRHGGNILISRSNPYQRHSSSSGRVPIPLASPRPLSPLPRSSQTIPPPSPITTNITANSVPFTSSQSTPNIPPSTPLSSNSSNPSDLPPSLSTPELSSSNSSSNSSTIDSSAVPSAEPSKPSFSALRLKRSGASNWRSWSSGSTDNSPSTSVPASSPSTSSTSEPITPSSYRSRSEDTADTTQSSITPLASSSTDSQFSLKSNSNSSNNLTQNNPNSSSTQDLSSLHSLSSTKLSSSLPSSNTLSHPPISSSSSTSPPSSLLMRPSPLSPMDLSPRSGPGSQPSPRPPSLLGGGISRLSSGSGGSNLLGPKLISPMGFEEWGQYWSAPPTPPRELQQTTQKSTLLAQQSRPPSLKIPSFDKDLDRDSERDSEREKEDTMYRIIPIDHGYCLPHVNFLSETENSWLHWRAVKQPIREEIRRHIASLNYRSDWETLRKAFVSAIPTSSLLTLQAGTLYLQLAIQNKYQSEGEVCLNLFDLASAMTAEEIALPSLPRSPSSPPSRTPTDMATVLVSPYQRKIREAVFLVYLDYCEREKEVAHYVHFFGNQLSQQQLSHPHPSPTAASTLSSSPAPSHSRPLSSTPSDPTNFHQPKNIYHSSHNPYTPLPSLSPPPLSPSSLSTFQFPSSSSPFNSSSSRFVPISPPPSNASSNLGSTTTPKSSSNLSSQLSASRRPPPCPLSSEEESSIESRLLPSKETKSIDPTPLPSPSPSPSSSSALSSSFIKKSMLLLNLPSSASLSSQSITSTNSSSFLSNRRSLTPHQQRLTHFPNLISERMVELAFSLESGRVLEKALNWVLADLLDEILEKKKADLQLEQEKEERRRNRVCL